MGDLNFNLENVKEVEYPLVQDGLYRAHAVDGKVGFNQETLEKYLSLAFEITEGKASGRRLFRNFTLESPEADRQTKGQGALGKYCILCNKKSGVVENVSDLFFFPIMIKVGSYVSSKTGKPTNCINGFYPCEEKARQKTVIEQKAQTDFEQSDIPF